MLRSETSSIFFCHGCECGVGISMKSVFYSFFYLDSAGDEKVPESVLHGWLRRFIGTFCVFASYYFCSHATELVTVAWIGLRSEFGAAGADCGQDTGHWGWPSQSSYANALYNLWIGFFVAPSICGEPLRCYTVCKDSWSSRARSGLPIGEMSTKFELVVRGLGIVGTCYRTHCRWMRLDLRSELVWGRRWQGQLCASDVSI